MNTNGEESIDLMSLIRSFWGIGDEGESLTDDDLSEEEYIKKGNEISEQVKKDLINALLHRNKLEAMLDHSIGKRTKIEILKVDRSDKNRNKLTVENIKKSKTRKNGKGKEIVND